MKILVRSAKAFVSALIGLLFSLGSTGGAMGEDVPAAKKESGAVKGDPVSVEAFANEIVRKELENKTFSPDKRLFAGFYQDGWTETISIHDAASEKQIRRIVGHGDFVSRFKFSADGELLSTWDKRKGWKVWKVSTGKLVLELPNLTSGSETPKIKAERQAG